MTTRNDDELARLVRASLERHPAPDSLRTWARARAREAASAEAASAPDPGTLSIARAPRPRTVTRGALMLRRAAYAASLLIAMAVGWTGGRSAGAGRASSASGDQLTGELVTAHVRSLMAQHLVDVVSSDRHTVKPWFTGKADFSLPVYDLASAGFPLIGGRLDYVHAHEAAVLVYGRHGHVINLFVWPSGATDVPLASHDRAAMRGFALMHWVAAGLEYWAVSDASPAELDAFRAAYDGAR